MKTRQKEAQEALWKEILKGDSKKIWHGVHWEDLTPEQRKLILPMMKNYIEKYLPSVIGSHACLVLPVLAGCGLSRSHTQWLVAYPPSGLVAEAYGRVASPSRMHNSTNYNKWSG